jgi:hypothetical protein
VDVPWACLAAYVYVLHLEPASRAWEFLRRNPRYVREWMRHHRSASQRIAARWGLATLVDPRLDAREASPLWVIGAQPTVTLVREEMRSTQMRATAAELFSVWRLAGRKTLLHDGAGFRLVVRLSAQEVQLRLGDRLTAGDRFAYQIPAAGDDRAAWAALTAFRALIPASGSGEDSSRERPGRADLFHVRALQVLDGLAAGASQRELAVALFGSAAVAHGWQSDGALRAQARYLIRRARALMTGEYRSLIAADPSGSRARRKGASSPIPTARSCSRAR